MNQSFEVQVSAPAPQPPVPTLTVTCPSNRSVNSPSGQPVVVTYPAATTTGGQAPITLQYSPPSGSTFPVGVTQVLVQASSFDGQSVFCLFNVTVVDTSVPPPGLAISCPGTQQAVSLNGSPVAVSYPPATPSGGTPPYTVTYSHPSGSQFAVGTTTVTATVTDSTSPPTQPPGSQPAVPGAYGFGMQTRAAYGLAGVNPVVLRVTNLNDSGPGSFRAAVTASGPRIVIFETSGTIVLNDDVNIFNPYLTIAGQTAPSPGILLRRTGNVESVSGLLGIGTHDVLIQHLEIRVGDDGLPQPQTQGRDGILLYNFGINPSECYNVVLDHVSVSWAGGKQINIIPFSAGGPTGITLWRSIISEALYRASNVIVGPAEPSSLGILIAGETGDVTIAECLLAHNATRNPELHEHTRMQLVNNVMYDWGRDEAINPWASFIYARAGGPDPCFGDFVNGVYIGGPSPHPSLPLYAVGVWAYQPGTEIYVNGNLSDSTVVPITDYFLNAGFADPRVGSPTVPLPAYTPRPTASVKSHVLTNAGCRPADRGVVDTRIVNEVLSYGGTTITSQNQVGGFPVLAQNPRSLTIPTAPHTYTPTGYTNLENWLHDFADDVEGTTSTPPGSSSFCTFPVVVVHVPPPTQPGPLVQAGQVVWDGAFRLPAGTFGDSQFDYGGWALGYNPATNRLFVAGHDFHNSIAEITIPTPSTGPAIGNLPFATVTQPFRDPTENQMGEIQGYPNYQLGGMLMYGGRLIVAAYSYFDAAFGAVGSHFTRPPNLLSVGQVTGVHRVGSLSLNPAFYAGNMCDVPAVWQSSLGGPAITGQGALPIIGRTSLGPSAFTFDPNQLGLIEPCPAVSLLYYPIQNPYTPWDQDFTNFFNGTTELAGCCIPAGKRSILFFGHQGTGDFCYRCWSFDEYCPGDVQAKPYQVQIWAYDLDDLARVRIGQLQPWALRPYSIWPLAGNVTAQQIPFISSCMKIRGLAYDPVGNRIWTAAQLSDGDRPVIHQFHVV